MKAYENLYEYVYLYDKPMPGAIFLYEFCCCFPQNFAIIYTNIITSI